MKIAQDNFAASVTAIVPARDEEAVIAACVKSLAQQLEICEILVVNDGSTDRTAEIVRALAKDVPQLCLLDTKELPAGWVGKNHAASLGAQEAKSLWLLFVDADAELLPGAVARALQLAQDSGAALISFSPQQITETWYEKGLIPFVYCRLSKKFSFAAVNDPTNSAAAANGQFLMIRRNAYDAIGGHASVASNVLEDVALARRVKAAGYRLWFASGMGIVRVRMYRSFDAMWRGWQKNLYLLNGGTPGTVFRETLSVVPWLALILLLLGMKFPFALLAGLGLLVARHAAYGSALASNGFPVSFIFYYVPGVTLYTLALWESYRAHAGGKVEWKGREVTVGVADTPR